MRRCLNDLNNSSSKRPGWLTLPYAMILAAMHGMLVCRLSAAITVQEAQAPLCLGSSSLHVGDGSCRGVQGSGHVSMACCPGFAALFGLHAQPTQCAVPLSTSVAVMACQRCTALHMRIVGCTTATTRHAIPAIAVHVRPLHLPGPSSKLRRAAVAATEAAAPLVATSAAGGDPHADHQPAVRIT